MAQEVWNDSTEGRTLALHVAHSGLIPSTPYDSLNLPGVIPECKQGVIQSHARGRSNSTEDYSIIPSILHGPQEEFLSTEPEVAPGCHQVWPQNKQAKPYQLWPQNSQSMTTAHDLKVTQKFQITSTTKSWRAGARRELFASHLTDPGSIPRPTYHPSTSRDHS